MGSEGKNRLGQQTGQRRCPYGDRGEQARGIVGMEPLCVQRGL